MGELLALDLFCGAGGAALGMLEAGFDRVMGIDIRMHKHYPGDFIQGDALHPPVNIKNFHFVWASPPCQLFSVGLNACPKLKAKKDVLYPNLIPETRRILAGHPLSCIENIPQAPIRCDLVLTGPSVGLYNLKRTRHFELSFFMLGPRPIIPSREDWRSGKVITVTKGNSNNKKMRELRKKLGMSTSYSLKEKREAMGIPDGVKMTHSEVGEAVPPAYAKLIASEALRQIKQKLNTSTPYPSKLKTI